jgi:hypothetical protein
VLKLFKRLNEALTVKKNGERILIFVVAAVIIASSACKVPEVQRVEYSPSSKYPVQLKPAQTGFFETTFAGSDSCRECHLNIYSKWILTSHSRELKAEEYESPPHEGNCTRCHSTSSYEKRVGCEACHGPRSDHVRSPQQTEPVDCRICDIQKMCIQCHVRVIDSNFDPGRAWKMIDHGKNE